MSKTTVQRDTGNGYSWVVIDGKPAGFVQKTAEGTWEAWLHSEQPLPGSTRTQPRFNRRLGLPFPTRREAVDEIEIRAATEGG